MNYSQKLFNKASRIEVLGESLIFKTLSNGLKVLYKKVAHSHVAHCGLVINAGSRDDDGYMGAAHCMEHMLFKGTQKRKSFHILNRIDSVGGEINAYTTKEVTVLYSTVYEVFLDRAVELLFDVAYHSTFPVKELAKERKVIKDEIRMYEDSPDDNIFDEFQELIFKDNPLAGNILGTEKSLDTITSKTLRDFTSVYYKPENMVFVVVSDLPSEKIFRKIEKYALQPPLKSDNKSGFNPIRKKNQDFNVQTVIKETDHVQSYVVIGGQASQSNSPDRLKETLLLNILGGPALNSRLSLAIREKYGFTYNIEAGTTHFTDTGFFHCFAGTDNAHHKKTIALIHKELEKLKNKKLGALQMHNALNQFTGQIMLAEENKLSSVIAMGRQWAQGEKVLTLREILEYVNSITAVQLLEVANRLFEKDKLSLLSYIPSKD
ncbi:MAG: insulinase family protein [Bacteroidia bacterium]|nr:insulinase family protein [Bacteroidia bacterium]